MILLNLRAIFLMAFLVAVRVVSGQSNVAIRSGIELSHFDKLDLYGPNIGLDIMSKDSNHHVFSIRRIRVLNQEFPDYQLNQVYISLGYQYERRFLKKNKLQPALGVFSELTYQRMLQDPIDPNLIGFEVNSLGVAIFGMPSLHYRFQKIELNLTIPINILTGSARTQRVDNVNIPISQRKNSTTDLPWFEDALRVHLSVGYTF